MFIIDDIINAIAGSNAASAQERSAREAMGLQREMWETQQGMHRASRADQMPWVTAGQSSLADLLRLKDDPSSIASSPGFQFRLSEGQKALERSAAARGGLSSGRFMKDMARFSQGLASDEYGSQWNRLAGLAGMGQGSAQSLGGLGANYAGLGGRYADSMSQLYGAQGNAQAAGHMAVGNGAAGGVRSLGNLAMLGMGGGIPGIAGLGGVNPGAPNVGASTGYASNYIPRQFAYGG